MGGSDLKNNLTRVTSAIIRRETTVMLRFTMYLGNGKMQGKSGETVNRGRQYIGGDGKSGETVNGKLKETAN